MSTIVMPMPPPSIEGRSIPRDACWWRLLLQPNEDGRVWIARLPEPTRVECEFFDGFDAIIDGGYDRPVAQARISGGPHAPHQLDILHTEQPTPSPEWRRITVPGNHIHPDDEPECTPSRREWQEPIT